MIYLQMIWEFFKTGLFSVGGGLATLPFLSKMADRYHWFTQEDLGNMLAISESTPGPIGVNMATYVGNIIGTSHNGPVEGFLCGGLVACSLVLPSYLVILIISKILEKFRGAPLVEGAMRTLRPASVGMVTAAVIGILAAVLIDLQMVESGIFHVFIWQNILLFLVLFVIYRKFQKLHPVVVILIGAVAGIVFKL